MPINLPEMRCVRAVVPHMPPPITASERAAIDALCAAGHLPTAIVDMLLTERTRAASIAKVEAQIGRSLTDDEILLVRTGLRENDGQPVDAVLAAAADRLRKGPAPP
jgi:hypothetical protein